VEVQHCANISENVSEVGRHVFCAVLSGVLGFDGSDMGENFGVAEGSCAGAKNLGWIFGVSGVA
jgi:hypothetical protein